MKSCASQKRSITPTGFWFDAGNSYGHALDEAHIEPAAGDHVDGRELFGTAQRIGPMADRIAEHQDSRVLGLARQHRQSDDNR
jgi:hypothetical protein